MQHPAVPRSTRSKKSRRTSRPEWKRRSRTCSTKWPSIRTGRASLSILDHIRVDYYGTPTPLNQVANLHVPEPALITIQPWDVSQIGPIEKVDPHQRPGPEPGQRRQDHPPADSAADRRAPQGTGQETARRGRAPSRGRAQHPPRRQRSREEAAQGQEDHRRRRQEGPRRNPEADRHATWTRSTRRPRPKKRTSWRSGRPASFQASRPRLSTLRTAAFLRGTAPQQRYAT